MRQLSSDASVPKPAKPVSSDYVTDSPTMVDVGEEREEPGEEVGQQQDELAGLFSGMAVSGEKAPRPVRPTQPVHPVRRAKPSPSATRARKQEEQSAFGDLLGLVSGSPDCTHPHVSNF